MEKKIVAANNEKINKYISDDIAFSILSKLPLKSLKRFGCVRKLWSILFENTYFMNMFRYNFSTNSNCCSYYDQASLILKLMDYDENVNQEVVYSLSGERFENKVKLDFSNPFEDKSYFNMFGFGSINGTICLYQASHANKLVLWNPTTKEYKLIPPSPFELSSVAIAAKYRNEDVCFDLQGFGYDHVTYDYKVIRWGMVLQQNHGNVWEIYSLRSNSWRKLDIDVDLDVTPAWRFDEGTQVYLDEVCHWLCRVHYDPLPSQPIHHDSLPRHIVHIPCLVSFSLSDDELFTTPTPLDLDDWFDDGM